MIAIIDYGAGNLQSVSNALDSFGCKNTIAVSRREILSADGVILPGVGAFGSAMQEIEKRGLAPAIKDAAQSGKPFLGICAGMQLLFERSEESPYAEGLGIIPGEVLRFDSSEGLKIPHMGWNSVKCLKESRLLGKAGEEAHMYFVHSYYVKAKNRDAVSGSCLYGTEFDAAIECGSVFGFQFHPEKSGECGIELLKKFVRICTE